MMSASSFALNSDTVSINFKDLSIEASSEVSRLLMSAITCVDRDETIAVDLIKRVSNLLRPHAVSDDEAGRRSTGGGLAPWQVSRVKKHIDENLSETMSLDDLAQLIRLSTSYFSTAFKVSFGMSPHNYVVSRRVELAKQRMSTSTASLSEIALDCGLSDQAHLSRIFRRATGTTPSAWRRFSTSREMAAVA